MTDPIDLPPEIDQVAGLLGEQRPEVRELFRYALVLAMIDDQKGRVIGTRVEEREWLTVETIADEMLEIMPPPISEQVEAQLMGQVRAIIADEEVHGP